MRRLESKIVTMLPFSLLDDLFRSDKKKGTLLSNLHEDISMGTSYQTKWNI